LFQPARWKAYLRSLQNASQDADGKDESRKLDNIYSIFHSQKIWFLRDEPSQHTRAADEHLTRCDALLGECTEIVDALEETLANTPKPSEVLDWGTIF
jgi:hypothetical protein